LEELLALAKIPLARVNPFPQGYVLCEVPLVEINDVWSVRNERAHLWTNSMEIDALGTTIQVSKEPVGFVAMSAWLDTQVASQKLCKDFIGEALWAKHQSGLINVVVQQLVQKFGLVARSVNSQEIPSVAKLSWGYLIQLPPNEWATLSDQIYLPALREFDLPIVHELGGHLITVLAIRPTDRVKLALCFNSMEREPIHEFQHWLFHKSESVAIPK
jgi:hypothetical protein